MLKQKILYGYISFRLSNITNKLTVICIDDDGIEVEYTFTKYNTIFIDDDNSSITISWLSKV